MSNTGPHTASMGVVVEIEAGDYLTAAEAAELVGVARDTFTSYVSRGLGPAPANLPGRQKLYRRDVVEAWNESRPGRGARTDLRREKS